MNATINKPEKPYDQPDLFPDCHGTRGDLNLAIHGGSRGGARGGRRVNGRGKVVYDVPNGYAAAPGTGPAGETCRTCEHAVSRHMSKNYWKCALMQAHWAGSSASDIRLKSPACAKFTEARKAREGKTLQN